MAWKILQCLGVTFLLSQRVTDKKKYWTVCHSMLEWIEKHILQLPARCTILAFGDVNDDFGMPRQGSTAVSSLAIGEARIGRERFVGAKVRVLCERHHLGLASTFFHTGPTYQGHGHESYVDTWFFSSLSSIQKYKTLPRLAAKFRGITSKTTDHIPVMVDFEFNLLQHKPHQGFKWDREAMMRSNESSSLN